MKLLRKMKSELALTVEAEVSVTHHTKHNFHESFSFVIIFAQFFGIMPLHGMASKNPADVQFKWKSCRFYYSIFNIVGALIMGLFCIANFAIKGLMLDKTGTMSFYILNFFATMQFIEIARHWPTILKECAFVEMSMRNYDSFLKTDLKRKFKVMTSTVMILALIEHLLFIANSFFMGKTCDSTESPDAIYFRIAFPSVFTLVAYSPWAATLVEACNIISTVTWNFTDLFIMLISYSLASRFTQFNQKLLNNTNMHEKFWNETREDYNKLAHLVRVMDKYLAPLVMVSFVSNTFFICVQLYNSLKIRVSEIETVYYFFSFGFLLGRTIAVTLYGAWIHDESRKPLQVLHSIPSEYYCGEISRLVEQINTSPVGITGSKFFIITRSFLLKMASTIVTFELMFLQFGPLIKGNLESDYKVACTL